MKLKLRAFGIAKDIIGSSTLSVTDSNARTVGDLKNHLKSTYPQFESLLKFSLAVDEEYRDDDHILKENDEVIIIPPVSGG